MNKQLGSLVGDVRNSLGQRTAARQLRFAPKKGDPPPFSLIIPGAVPLPVENASSSLCRPPLYSAAPPPVYLSEIGHLRGRKVSPELA